jgi:ABC-type nickel/cobalt efflux system permease component RcnA
VTAIDGWLEGFMHQQGSITLVLLASLALGLRHATDPDHLAAVTTIIAFEEERSRVRKAGVMGLAWGLGHGTTLMLIGIPLMLMGRYLPGVVQQIAEVAIGGIIMLLAARLILRWRRGLFHIHAHSHEGETHRHVHTHSRETSHAHAHAAPGRMSLSSYGVGLVHGVGGSGGLTLLLLSTIPDKTEATGALLLFASGTAASMALLSTAFGLAIAGGPIGRNFERAAPVLGALSMAFGGWYALGALRIVAYPF